MMDDVNERTGTMERIQTQGEIATAHSLARMISAVPPSATGPSQVVIFDIHTLQNQFYFRYSFFAYHCLESYILIYH